MGPELGNPAVFRAMLDTMLSLVDPRSRRDTPGRGAVHLEADGHQLPEPARGAPAAAGAARPGARGGAGVIFKAEAIVAPEQLVQYLGGHDRYRPECDLAYHNQLMVMLWSSLAARDGRLATTALPGCDRRRARPTG